MLLLHYMLSLLAEINMLLILSLYLRITRNLGVFRSFMRFKKYIVRINMLEQLKC